ncbi:hypothetical protein WDV06_04335 [Streptomyces racemochromogenes]|uniref:Transposase n=1 Tax=Streptomyces racemochromogenes TaxID=67353 RepID=A0ABW7P7L2_9ACTN
MPLRQVREGFADRETGVIEAAERRYSCGRLGAATTPSGQRLTAIHRANAAGLRRLTGQITALALLGPEVRVPAPPSSLRT